MQLCAQRNVPWIGVTSYGAQRMKVRIAVVDRCALRMKKCAKNVAKVGRDF